MYLRSFSSNFGWPNNRCWQNVCKGKDPLSDKRRGGGVGGTGDTYRLHKAGEPSKVLRKGAGEGGHISRVVTKGDTVTGVFWFRGGGLGGVLLHGANLR